MNPAERVRGFRSRPGKAAPRGRTKLGLLIARRARAWALRRQGMDRIPLRLENRRIYILPTQLGVIYAVALFAMLLASMNYNNSSGFLLTFLLASLGLVSMFHCQRNLSGLLIEGLTAGEAFAGSPLPLRVGCANPGAIARYGITVECDGQFARLPRIDPGARALLEIPVPTQRRGIFRPQRLVVSTTFPLGLFRAWSWMHVPFEAVVYPRAGGRQALPASVLGDQGSLEPRRRGDDDFKGFRDYVPGDSPRHIAWKAVARGAPLLVKDLAGAARAPQMLELDAVRARELEARLSQLTRWVLQIERENASFGLVLPEVRISPANGAEQRRRCLTALALHALPQAQDER